MQYLSQTDKREIFNHLKPGDIIKYKSGQESEENYIRVKAIEWGRVYGQMIEVAVVPTGNTSILIEELVKKECSLASF